ncbi:MAG: diiron oxygenase [Rhodococcus sp. (in: high G+C Gram-positive bacteria)]
MTDLTRAVRPTTTRRAAGDREATAARLLRSTADRAYDGEVDIDWSAPIDPHAKWVPDRRHSLYGTTLWDKLTEEQRLELGRHEAVSVLSYGIMAEVFLSTMLLRSVAESSRPTSAHNRYALAEVAEETRHSTMFGRVIDKTGVPLIRQPWLFAALLNVAGFVPRGPSIHAGTLFVEEVLDRFQRELMDDPEIQPHLRQMMKIHVLEEARHITFAREELVRSIEVRGRVSNAGHRMLTALQATVTVQSLIHPSVYRSVGISPLRGWLAAVTSPRYRDRAVFSCEPLIRFLYDVGMIRGAVTTRVYRLARVLPADLEAEIFGPA